MIRFWLAVTAVTFVSACSGNPFLEETEGETPVAGIPEEIRGDLESFTYDPVAKTLIVRGIALDEGQTEAVYNRNPALDQAGYEAYTIQDDPLDRHVTAYVKEIDGTRAAIVVTGGQFGYYFGGGSYSRSGAFDPPAGGPNGGLVSYAGRYVGLLNSAGNGGDLLATAPGTPAEVLPGQAAAVTGSIFINADFADNVVNGVIYDRVIPDRPDITEVDNQQLILVPTEILSDGTFVGELEETDPTDADPRRTDVGSYGGIFGGTGASAVAGVIFAADHLGANSEEYGLFVLSQCSAGNTDPICDQVNP